MILHGFWLSSAAHRLRIALNLKGLAPDFHPVHLRRRDQGSEAYLALNPQGLVPALEIEGAVLTQSLAIVEWLDETHPEPPLLPADPLTRAAGFPLADQPIRLSVNGRLRQDGRLSDMVWSVPELVSHLSRYYHLGPGDLIYTGTPAGVGPVVPGDQLEGSIDGLDALSLTIGAAE